MLTVTPPTSVCTAAVRQRFTISVVSFWNVVLFPAGGEAVISVCELEISASAPLVCSAQLTLPVSVLLIPLLPRKNCWENWTCQLLSFLKIQFGSSCYAGGSYKCLFLARGCTLKTDFGELGSLSCNTLSPSSSLTFHRWSLIIFMCIQLLGSVTSSQDSFACACAAVTTGTYASLEQRNRLQ